MRGYQRLLIPVLLAGLIVIGVLIITTSQIRAASIWYVSPGGSDSNSCQLHTAPCGTINGGIAKASAGDSIYIAQGIYTNPNPTTNDIVTLDKDVVLSGGWDSTFSEQTGYTTIDGENQYRCMFIPSGVTGTIDRFYIQNGNWSPAASSGISSMGAATVQNSVITNNNGVTAGGIDVSAGRLILDSSSVINNVGNGIHQSGGSIILINSTVSGNGQTGIVATGLKLFSSTISNHPGFGISVSNLATTQNSIIAGNSGGYGPDCDTPGGSITSSGNNIVGNLDGCNFVPTDEDMTNTDPSLGSLEGTPPIHPLVGGSPAINAGSSPTCKDHEGIRIDYDQRGFPRLDNCDIGSVEAQSFKVVNDSTPEHGDHISFHIQFRSWKDTSQEFNVIDTIPEGLIYSDGSLNSSTGIYDYQNGVITWYGTVDPGEIVSIWYLVEIGQVLGKVTNEAVISSGGDTQIRLAEIEVDSPVCGLNKYPANPVLEPGGTGKWDHLGVSEPAVIRVGDIYMMWYTGENGSHTQIGLARSNDGINWIKEPSNPVITAGSNLQHSSGIEVGDVIYTNGRYQLWYTGIDSDGISRIFYTSSPDGVAWTTPGIPVLETGSPGSWEDEFIYSPTVVKDKQTYHMWYTGYDGATSRIGYATSNNAIEWVKRWGWDFDLEPGEPGAWDWLDVYGATVMDIGGDFKIFYSGETLPEAWQIGYAESRANFWDRKGLLIAEGNPGEFDVNGADYPSVLVDENIYKFWYTGFNGQYYSIGYAESTACEIDPPPVTENAAGFLPYMANGDGPCPAYYTENFSDPTSGWPIDDNSLRSYAYSNGEYQIIVKNPNSGWLVTPGARAVDFSVQISARRAFGNNGRYGIVFAIDDDWSQYYQAVIEDDSYSIWRYDGDFGPIVNWTYSPAIIRGTGWNRIKINRNNYEISLYINDIHQTTIRDFDGSFQGYGRIGLIAGSPQKSSIDARFDDFSLSPFPCEATSTSELLMDGIPDIHESAPWSEISR